MCIEISKPKIFDHLLAQQVASNHFIDLADKVEPIQSLGPVTDFSGNIIIEAEKKAVEKARKYRAGNVFWVDGFKLSQKNAEAAIC